MMKLDDGIGCVNDDVRANSLESGCRSTDCCSSSTTSEGSLSAPSIHHVERRKDHEFIPTRMKAIDVSKPVANPMQFTKIPSNPLLISAQKQLIEVEHVKRLKDEIFRASEQHHQDDDKTFSEDDCGEDENSNADPHEVQEDGRRLFPRTTREQDINNDHVTDEDGGKDNWQNQLTSWKCRRRKQSEETFQRVSALKDFDSSKNVNSSLAFSSRRSDSLHSGSSSDKISSLGRKLSNLVKIDDDNDLSDLGLSNHERRRTSDVPPFVKSSSRGHLMVSGSSRSGVSSIMSRSQSQSSYVRKFSEGSLNIPHVSHFKKSPLSPIKSVELCGEKNDNSTQNMSSTANGGSSDSSSPQSSSQQDHRRSSVEPSKSKVLPSYVKPRGQQTNGETDSVVEQVEKQDFKSKLLAFEKIAKINDDQTRKPKSLRQKENIIKTTFASTESTNGGSNAEGREQMIRDPPPPPLSYSKLINANSVSRSNQSQLLITSSPSCLSSNDNVDKSHENKNNLEEALEDSYKTLLNDSTTSSSASSSSSNGQASKVNNSTCGSLNNTSDNLITTNETFNSDPCGTPESSRKGYVMDYEDERDIMKDEQDIIDNLEMEEREHLKYKERKISSILAATHGHTVSSNTFSQESQLQTIQKPTMKASTVEEFPPTHQSKPNMSCDEPDRRHKNEKEVIYQNVNNGMGSGTEGGGGRSQLRENNVKSTNLNNSDSAHHLVYSTQRTSVSSNSSSCVSEPASNQHNYSHHPNNNSYLKHERNNNENTFSTQIPPNHMDRRQTSLKTRVEESRDDLRPIPGPQVPPRSRSCTSDEFLMNGIESGSSKSRMLSVSGRKRCSNCQQELGRGAAMIIESLHLYFHLRCFQCCVCHIQLSNGSIGTDVRVRNFRLHCQNCYSNDDGLKFSKV